MIFSFQRTSIEIDHRVHHMLFGSGRALSLRRDGSKSMANGRTESAPFDAAGTAQQALLLTLQKIQRELKLDGLAFRLWGIGTKIVPLTNPAINS